MNDDLGAAVHLPRPPRRVVSLVPSLTEAIAVSAPGLLAGATDYCTHPPSLDVPRVGGTKYPSVERVRALAPDLVVANAEETRREDVEALRAAGVPVWVTYPRTLDEALASLARLLAVLGAGEPAWLADARTAWTPPPSGPPVRAVIPVWRRPWVVLGGETFAGDLLRRLGVQNLYGGSQDRYPRPPLAEILARTPDLVVLPDEPYAFTPTDGPEAFPGVRCALVSGRHLTWYGPSLAGARALLATQLDR
ncbi:helical backbone metal receptor [Phytohabitans houttuyneae]|uniref:ABC transporter substrate-binding protein n=1 Tax=Phytohabitans houttuyneae TaxID=1076126 RepID=A0A6V8KP31_9ACTN|nr:helical backbone metal receptor [Phytohabitans houttuyneae]GFJ85604.1 ABC transporter substrate-binding protein [Phytohabitans houttuyneae]